jgi:formate dehydrogenase maturation protein FdhE
MSAHPRNLFNPPLAEGVRRFGFRKWYERELLSSHAHLLLTLLSSVALIGLLEAFQDASPSDKLLNVLLFIASGAIGLWALRRYLYLLTHAEAVANQANCPACGTYARFEVMGEDRRSGQIVVRCRACRQEWTIEA